MAVPTPNEIRHERNPRLLTSHLFKFRAVRKRLSQSAHPALSEADRADTLAFWDARIEAAEKRLQAFLPQARKAVTPVPNAALQSALFRVADKRRPRNERVLADFPIQGGGCLRYDGPELRQDDLSVLLGLFELARYEELSAAVSFTPASLMRRIGWSAGGDSYDRLDRCISRMQKALIEYVAPSGEGFRVQLLGKLAFANRTPQGAWVVAVDPSVRALFDAGYSKMALHLRATLPEGLTTWLAGFYASYPFVKPMPLRELHEHCGSSAQPREFRRMLTAAMDRMQQHGLVSRYTIKRGTLFVWK